MKYSETLNYEKLLNDIINYKENIISQQFYQNKYHHASKDFHSYSIKDDSVFVKNILKLICILHIAPFI